MQWLKRNECVTSITDTKQFPNFPTISMNHSNKNLWRTRPIKTPSPSPCKHRNLPDGFCMKQFAVQEFVFHRASSYGHLLRSFYNHHICSSTKDRIAWVLIFQINIFLERLLWVPGTLNTCCCFTTLNTMGCLCLHAPQMYKLFVYSTAAQKASKGKCLVAVE